LKEFLFELWQNHHDPYHAAYGIGGVIVLLVIYNRLLNKYQLQETLPEIPTTERVIKSTRNYYRINLCLAANVECADEVWPQLIYSKRISNKLI